MPARRRARPSCPGAPARPVPGRSRTPWDSRDEGIEEAAPAALVHAEPEAGQLRLGRGGVLAGEVGHAHADLAHDAEGGERGAAPGGGGGDVDEVGARPERHPGAEPRAVDGRRPPQHGHRRACRRDAPADLHGVAVDHRGVRGRGEAQRHARLGTGRVAAPAGGEGRGAGEEGHDDGGAHRRPQAYGAARAPRSAIKVASRRPTTRACPDASSPS